MAPQDAAERTLAYLKKRLNGHGGIILVDTRGRFGMAYNTPRMAWALTTEEQVSSGVDLQ